ncbi:DUF397 domain-containing protein [Streptomyces sp. NPDC059851]|uniref:DUF397 domain-containing protein n=1 Tax=Streptomyces sp. NPDC059851 TaxID=3346971 RepID=UPI00364C2A19
MIADSRHALSAANWRKSSYSNTQGGDCVEVADGVAGAVPVRDSKCSSGPVVIIGERAWGVFVGNLRQPS